LVIFRLGALVHHSGAPGSVAGEIGIESISTEDFHLSGHTGRALSGTVDHAHGYAALCAAHA